MDKFELDKNITLSVLKDLVFPLKDLILSKVENGYAYNVLVSLHEHNCIYPGGFPVDENVLELLHTQDFGQNATVRLIVRYLSNIDFIRIYVNVKSFNISKEIVIDTKFSSFGYSVSGLNGFYKFGELPLKEDLDLLVSSKTKNNFK